MRRLAGLLVVVAACSDSGPGTGDATLSNVSPAVKSSSSVSFKGLDGNGTNVLGWKIEFYSSKPGSDCKSMGTAISSSIGIFTNQAVGSATKATLQTGDIFIVTTSPPTATGSAVANMGANGVSNIMGVVTVTDFAPDHITGTVNAGGADNNGNSVTLAGTFTAPVCD